MAMKCKFYKIALAAAVSIVIMPSDSCSLLTAEVHCGRSLQLCQFACFVSPFLIDLGIFPALSRKSCSVKISREILGQVTTKSIWQWYEVFVVTLCRGMSLLQELKLEY